MRGGFSECGAQHPVNRLDYGIDQHAADWEAVGHSLCHCDDVSAHSMVLMCEEFTCPAIS